MRKLSAAIHLNFENKILVNLNFFLVLPFKWVLVLYYGVGA